MTTFDLTEEQMSPVEDLVYHNTQMTSGDAIDLAWDVMRAVAPLIEAAVRESVAKDIEAERVRLYGTENMPLHQQPRQEQSLCYAKARDIARHGLQ